MVIGCGDYQPIKHYSGTRANTIENTLLLELTISHIENAGYTEPIYADPSRALHQIFNLIENLKLTPSDQPKKSYLANRSYWGNVFSSIWVCTLLANRCENVLSFLIFLCAVRANEKPWVYRKARKHLTAWGRVYFRTRYNCPISRVPVIEILCGTGEQCSYASRMEHTEDRKWHPNSYLGRSSSCTLDVEVADLMKEAGVEYPWCRLVVEAVPRILRNSDISSMRSMC